MVRAVQDNFVTSIGQRRPAIRNVRHVIGLRRLKPARAEGARPRRKIRTLLTPRGNNYIGTRQRVDAQISVAHESFTICLRFLAMTNRLDTGCAPVRGTAQLRDRNLLRFVSFAEYFAVRNVTRAGHPHLALDDHARAERDIAVDLQSAAAAQRGRPAREPPFEIGQELVKGVIQ